LIFFFGNPLKKEGFAIIFGFFIIFLLVVVTSCFWKRLYENMMQKNEDYLRYSWLQDFKSVSADLKIQHEEKESLANSYKKLHNLIHNDKSIGLIEIYTNLNKYVDKDGYISFINDSKKQNVLLKKINNLNMYFFIIYLVILVSIVLCLNKESFLSIF
jgi:hypothetical protein